MPNDWLDNLLDAMAELSYNRYVLVGPHWMFWIGSLCLLLDGMILLFPGQIGWTMLLNKKPVETLGEKLLSVGVGFGFVFIGWMSFRLRSRWAERSATVGNRP